MRSRSLIRTAFYALIMAGGVAGCDTARLQLSAAEQCAPEAAVYDGVVSGAFDTTVGATRRFEAGPADQQGWPGLPDAYPAIMCYIDGDIAKALGGGDAAFNHVVGVVNGAGQMVMAGFKDRLPVRAP